MRILVFYFCFLLVSVLRSENAVSSLPQFSTSHSFPSTLTSTRQPTPAEPTSMNRTGSSQHFCPTCSSIPPEVLTSLDPAYSHLPNVSAIYLPLNITDINQVASFCRNKPSGSYCYFGPNSTNCWSGMIVDCPSGLLSVCKPGFVCMVKMSSGFPMAIDSSVQVTQPTAASCIAPFFHTNAAKPTTGSILQLDGLITMCQNPAEPFASSTKIVNCLYFASKNTPTSTSKFLSPRFSASSTTSSTAILPAFSIVSHSET